MRVAHCSDLHLLSHEGARWLDLANKRWIGAMNLLSNRSRHYHVDAFLHMIEDMNAQRIDHVLCTGDVTNLALEQEFKFARGMFDQLAAGPEHVTVIPGNHDAYVAEGIAHFATVFDEYHRGDADWTWTDADRDVDDRDDDLRWPIVRIRGDLALIGVTTSRATPWFTAYGRVGSGQLARLRKALSDPRLAGPRVIDPSAPGNPAGPRVIDPSAPGNPAGKVRLVAIHHPPAGKRAANKIRGLRDHGSFAQVIADVGADLIVHGHEHQDLTDELAGPTGPIPVRGIASGTYHHNKPDRIGRYRIFEIAAGKIVSDYVRVWNRASGVFEAQPGTSQQSNYVS